jgi:LuxR family maltose regulon positive regulatory protein
MASPLVHTKLYIPRLRRGLVARSRVSDRLDAAAESKLVVISAPAGFGKTTAVAAWLERAPEHSSVAWLSLDEGDREPVPFWTSVMAALQASVPGLGDGVPEALQSAHRPIEPLLAAVLNELGDLDHDLFLVLDDYHLVDGPAITEGMVFLLDHLPSSVHVVLTTRADPALPLARLRVRGELVELRASDLRFTPGEVAAYFTQAGGPELDETDVAALASRTEGWIAALQLVALSLQDRADASSFIAGFSGDNRYIVDYLVEEVLARQPEQVRAFLLQTSILDRLTGDLCDAVTAQGGGKAMLETVSRANLFLASLDETRTWYRYHNLFADMLKTHLRDERSDQLPELHGRASRWFEQAGETVPSVAHAIAAGDLDRAAGLVELAMPVMLRERKEATIRGWIPLLPDAMVRARPVLAVGFIGALMSGGDFAGARSRLRDLDRLVRPGTGAERASDPELVVVDEPERVRLPGLVELYWAALSLVDGDLTTTRQHAKAAIELAAPADDLTRAGAWVLSALASWSTGELDEALRAYSAGMDGLLRAGNLSDLLGSSIAVADIELTQGHLGRALATFEHGLQLVFREPGVVRGTPDMYVGMSRILLERDDVLGAVRLVLRSQELGEHLGLPQNAYRWRRVLALASARKDDLEGALELVDQAQAVHFADFSPDVTPLPALKARLEAASGNIDAALAWATEHSITDEDELSYLHEYDHITLARVLLARFDADRSQPALQGAVTLMERLLVAAELGGRTGSVIEILVLQSLGLQRAGAGRTDVLEPLRRALELAEPEGYVQVFATGGPGVRALLQQLARQQPASAYLRRLIDACVVQPASGESTAPGGHANAQQLLDPLSDRELEVLRLLGTDLDGPDLARHLSVSLNTLRTHTKNIYSKLGVNSRRAAVRRAAELELLTGNRGS